MSGEIVRRDGDEGEWRPEETTLPLDQRCQKEVRFLWDPLPDPSILLGLFDAPVLNELTGPGAGSLLGACGTIELLHR